VGVAVLGDRRVRFGDGVGGSFGQHFGLLLLLLLLLTRVLVVVCGVLWW
jgi:hypothetical protein